MDIYYSDTTKGFYDMAVSNYSLPSDAIKLTREEHNTLMNEINLNNKEIVVVDGKIELRVRKKTWDIIRNKRDILLTKSDISQLADFPGDKAAWSAYRQALRDIPQTYSDPDDVIWPTPPA